MFGKQNLEVYVLRFKYFSSCLLASFVLLRIVFATFSSTTSSSTVCATGAFVSTGASTGGSLSSFEFFFATISTPQPSRDSSSLGASSFSSFSSLILGIFTNSNVQKYFNCFIKISNHWIFRVLTGMFSSFSALPYVSKSPLCMTIICRLNVFCLLHGTPQRHKNLFSNFACLHSMW